MNAQLLEGIGVVGIVGLLYWRDRHLKAKFRGCRCCGRTHVKRTFKMYPIVGTQPSSVFPDPSGNGNQAGLTAIVIKDGRAPFTVYKFSECLHCGHFAMVESYDKRYTLASLRHRVHCEPIVFRHDSELFRRANLRPCSTLNLNFDPHLLGEPTFEERHLGFRWPLRSSQVISS
jgi:hypothetical protein